MHTDRVHLAVYSVRCTLYGVQYNVYGLRFTVYGLQVYLCSNTEINILAQLNGSINLGTSFLYVGQV